MAKVKVRVAVKARGNGEWESPWQSSAASSEMEAVLSSGFLKDGFLYWLEAELDIPEPVTVQAVVTPA